MKVAQLLNEERVDDYLKRLVKTFKIKKLGSGYFSTVFQHPVYSNVVVKVVRQADLRHIKYLRETMKYPNNPWFPKIVGIHQVRFHPRDMGSKEVEADEHLDGLIEGSHLVFMQKLEPCASNYKSRRGLMAVAQAVLKTIPDEYFVSDEDAEEAERKAARFKNKWDRRQALRRALRNVKPFMRREDYEELESPNSDPVFWKNVIKYTTDKDLAVAAQLMLKMNADDLHSGNIMWRGDQPVFTDPVASEVS